MRIKIEPTNYWRRCSVVGGWINNKPPSGKILRSMVVQGQKSVEKDNWPVMEIRIPKWFLNNFLVEFKKEFDPISPKKYKKLVDAGYIGDMWGSKIVLDPTILGPDMHFFSEQIFEWESGYPFKEV